MPKFVIHTILLLTIISCSESKVRVCYSFDERQCLPDQWSSSDANTSKEEDIKRFLSTQGVETEDIYVDGAFHEVTCLACEVCPTSTRIYVSIEEQYEDQLTNLSLLSLAKTECSNLP